MHKSKRFPYMVNDSLFVHKRYQKKIFLRIRKSKLNAFGEVEYSGMFYFFIPRLVEEISDFMEFLKILDFNRMNKRMLETLVKCGAFDSFRPNRAQLFTVLDHAIHLAQEFQRAEDGSQQSLFDLMDESEARQTETQLELPDIRDLPLK